MESKKKKLLIPTDFTIESLNVVKFVLNNRLGDCQYHVVLLHGIKMADSITELLFFSKAKELTTLSNLDFEEACNVIKNKYASIVANLHSDLFVGDTQKSFNHYLQANQIDEIFIPKQYKLRSSSRKSVDLLPFIHHCTKPVYQVEWNREAMMPEKGKLAEIFYNGVAG